MSQLAQDERKTEFVGTHVDPVTRDELVSLARRNDRSLSWVLRRALHEHLERAHSDEREEQ